MAEIKIRMPPAAGPLSAEDILTTEAGTKGSQDLKQTGQLPVVITQEVERGRYSTFVTSLRPRTSLIQKVLLKTYGSFRSPSLLWGQGGL